MVLKLFIEKIFLYKKITKNFINHNINFFSKYRFTSKNKVLVEINAMRDSHIIYSYISNILAKKFNAEIYGFNPRYFNSILNFVIYKIKYLLKIDYFKVYSSFNVKNFIYPQKKINKNKFLKIKKKILENIKSKSDIYDISISDVNIGDLIYDAYLRKYNVPTINIKDKKFIKFVEQIIYLFDFWKNFLEENEIKAIVLSHTTYEFGIMLRIAVHQNIPTYTAAPGFVYYHDKNNLTTFEMKNYKNEFRSLSIEDQINKKKISEEILKQKFSGKKTIENKVSLLPSNKLFGDVLNLKRVLKKNEKTKCLIAAHHFSDAPNAWGRLLFNDFYDWVQYLGELSERLDYDFYIKFHPMDQKENTKTAEFFLNKYKRFNLVNPNVSHEQLIQEGINLVLTAYGTIGMEYAYHNIPVINASINNPHINFSFNHNPTNLKEYEWSIKNYKDLDIQFNKDEISEYFYMRYLNAFYLYPDELTNTDIEPTHTAKAYSRWLNIFSISYHENLLKKIEYFINTKNFKLIDENRL